MYIYDHICSLYIIHVLFRIYMHSHRERLYIKLPIDATTIADLWHPALLAIKKPQGPLLAALPEPLCQGRRSQPCDLWNNFCQSCVLSTDDTGDFKITVPCIQVHGNGSATNLDFECLKPKLFPLVPSSVPEHATTRGYTYMAQPGTLPRQILGAEWTGSATFGWTAAAAGMQALRVQAARRIVTEKWGRNKGMIDNHGDVRSTK